MEWKDKFDSLLSQLLIEDEIYKGEVYRQYYDSYIDYLESAQWKIIREQRLKFDNHTCVKCESNVLLQVHHLNYDNLGEEPLSDLITVCKKCHAKLHKHQ